MIRIRLIDGSMPFDRWDETKWAFVHATGREVYDEERDAWFVEYEDDNTVDLPETE